MFKNFNGATNVCTKLKTKEVEMKKGKLRKIEAKAKLGLPLTDQEKAYYVVFSKIIKREVISGTMEM